WLRTGGCPARRSAPGVRNRRAAMPRKRRFLTRSNTRCTTRS
ncbi:MAG: hypothetical protein AVDCRST_MAG71-2784, partial [uncultured Lysobacter sp.]